MIESLDKEKCLACGTCVEICPMDVFRLVQDDKVHSSIAYQNDCQTCYNCELECPAGAIYVKPWRKKRTQAW